jgi:hypothetical protein
LLSIASASAEKGGDDGTLFCSKEAYQKAHEARQCLGDAQLLEQENAA